MALKWFKVVSGKGFVPEIKSFLSNSLLAVGRHKNTAPALDGGGTAVARQGPASDDALDFVVADAGQGLAVDGG